jgi:hypothetical protein
VPGGQFERAADETGFEALIRHHKLGKELSALQQLARMVYGPDVHGATPRQNQPAHGPIMMGYLGGYADDHGPLAPAVTFYESLLQCCRRESGQLR